MTENNAAQPGLTDEEIEAVRRALEIYAECYDTMSCIAAREGREPVASPVSVAFDIRKNMVNAVVNALSKLRAEGVQAGDERPTPAQTLAAHTDLLTYVLQDDVHNRLTPRVIDIAYTAFMQAKQANTEDGGASDWFNDTKPVVVRAIAKLRKDLMEDRAALASAPVAGAARPVIHQHGFASDNQKLRAINESLDEQLEEVMAERDDYHDWADELSEAIAAHLGVEIGENSSSNLPWLRALDAIKNAAPQASEAVPVGIINAARYAGFTFLRHADGSYTLQPIVMATAQADKDGGDCAKNKGAEDAAPEE